MEVTIEEKKQNPLLKRDEIKGRLKFEGTTPSNAQLLEVLTKELKVESNLIVIKNIYTSFGRQEAKFFAVAYNNKEVKDKIEMSTKYLKKKAEEKKKKEEEKTREEAVKAEPVEEVKVKENSAKETQEGEQ